MNKEIDFYASFGTFCVYIIGTITIESAQLAVIENGLEGIMLS